MRITHTFIITLIVSLFSYNSIASDNSNSSSNAGWELITSDNGIDMFERWVENEQKCKVRERSGKMTLQCNVENVIELISNAKKTPLWMNCVEKVNDLGGDSDKWFVYTTFEYPWPLGKQDMVSEYSIKKSANKTTIYINQAPSKYPKQKDIKRLDSFVARWDIIDTGKNKLKVTFTTLSKIPPEHPTWVQDPIVRKMFLSNLRNFKKILKEAQISQAH